MSSLTATSMTFSKYNHIILCTFLFQKKYVDIYYYFFCSFFLISTRKTSSHFSTFLEKTRRWWSIQFIKPRKSKELSVRAMRITASVYFWPVARSASYSASSSWHQCHRSSSERSACFIPILSCVPSGQSVWSIVVYPYTIPIIHSKLFLYINIQKIWLYYWKVQCTY